MAESKFCAGCLRSDEKNTGEAWCCDCTEMVCKTCSSFHKKLSPPHKVVPIENVSRLSSSLLKLSRHCEFHNDKKIVLFCCQHDQLVCDSCVSESHQNCKPVISIEKAAQGVQEGTAVTDLEKRIDKLTQIMEYLLRIYNREVHNFSEQKTNIKKHFADIKTKIISHLDKLEVDFNKDLDIKFNECSENFMKNKSDIQRKYGTMKTWKGDLTSLKDYASNIHLFHAIKYLDAKTHRAETAVRNVKPDNVIPKLTFKPSEQISKLYDIPSLGVLSLESSSIPIPSDLDIDQQGQAFVRTELSIRQLSLVTSFKTSKLDDTLVIHYGCFVPDNQLLLSSLYEEKVYLCDHDGSNTKTINLDYQTCDVTLYDRNTALVSAENKGIQIVDLKTLKPGKMINVKRNCHRITSLNGAIWVKSDTCTLSLIDIKGKMQKKVTTSFDPSDICLTKSGDIYCTDIDSEDVYVVTSDREQRVVCSSPHQSTVRALTVDDPGDIYITGFYSHNIQRISSDGQQSNIILTKEDGINGPVGLSFNHQTKELMVVNDCGKSVNIYKVS